MSPIPKISIVVALKIADRSLFGLHFQHRRRRRYRCRSFTRRRTRNRPGALSLSGRLHRQRRRRRRHIPPFLVTHSRTQRLKCRRFFTFPVLFRWNFRLLFGDVLEVGRGLTRARRTLRNGNRGGRGSCLALGGAAPRQTALPHPHQRDRVTDFLVKLPPSPVAAIAWTRGKGDGGLSALYYSKRKTALSIISRLVIILLIVEHI